MKSAFLIGIDEAGRGPLAGPVAVGVVLVANDFDWSLLPGVTDSKQLSEQRREAIYTAAKQLEYDGQLQVAVTLISAKQIDKQGIVPAVTKGIVSGLATVAKHIPEPDREKVRVLLDGGLKAPSEWLHQETIIKGDAKEKVIGLASIMAKVERDRYMRRVGAKAVYMVYNFAQHKGYGTKAHRAAIVENGLSSEHRASYCKNLKIL